MRNDLTYLSLIIDRSVSMALIAKEATNGLRDLIEKQKQVPGECRLSITVFDDKFDDLFTDADIKGVDEKTISIQPRGWTRLYDAVGSTVKKLGERLNALPEDQRPAAVIVAIITDGYENDSNEFTRKQVADMVKEQKEKYNWTFTFIGANQDSFAVAESIGISRGMAMNFSPDGAHSRKSYGALNSAVTRGRNAGISGQSVGAAMNYSTEERTSALAAADQHLAVDPKADA